MNTDKLGALRAQITPGPWICYADLPSAEPYWHIVTTANKMRVLANVHIEPGNAMDAANACLIAMGPDLLAEVTRLRGEVERMQWQDISTAPCDGTRILALVPPYGATTAHFDIHNSHRFICHSVLNRDAQPTHWMPLPFAPATGGSDAPSNG